MMMSKMPVGRTASKVARVVLGNSEASLQRGLTTRSKNVVASTRSGLGVQGANRLAVAQLPFRNVVAKPMGPLRRFEFSTAAAYSDTTPEAAAAVEAATIRWRDTVTSNTDDAPAKTSALYAPDAVFWGTVSEEVRDTPEQVRDYFDYFAMTPGLRMIEYNPSPPRVYGDLAIHLGDYVFAWDTPDGEVQVPARFSFVYRKDGDDWTIVEHHSSKMPEAPAALKPTVPPASLWSRVAAAFKS